MTARLLPQITSTSVRASEAKLLLWFEMNKDELSSIMQKPNFDSWVKSLLDRLMSLEGKDNILNAMFKIANADGEYHDSEQALITLTARHWNMSHTAS